MGLRNITVQYVGDTLYLPPLEREVKRITVRKPDVNGYEYFEKAYGEDGFTTCKCGQDMELSGEPRTCPSCGRLVYPDGY